MLNYINSKALENNLAITKKKVIVFPDTDLSFLESTKSVYGINNRLKNFLTEFYHPYPNKRDIINLFRQILLEDYWFYLNDSCYEVSKDRFMYYFKSLFIDYSKLKDQKDINTEQDADRLFQTFIEYLSNIYKTNQDLEGIKRYVKESSILIEAFPDLVSSNFTLITELWSDFLNFFTKDSEIFYVFKNAYEKSLKNRIDNTMIINWYKNKSYLFKNDYGEFFNEISTVYLNSQLTELKSFKNITDFNKLPSYNEIAYHFRKQTEYLSETFEQIYYLTYLLNNPLMKNLHRHLIYDINKKIRSISNSETESDFKLFIDNLFNILTDFKKLYPDTVLDCLLSLGKELSRLNNKSLIDLFTEKLIQFGFELVDNIIISDDWQLVYNKNHIKNIRTYLEIYTSSPENYKEILSALIVYLKIGGIFLSDTDLFQKDISKLLNVSTLKHFKLIKQLCRIFPVYFNEIGAEGDLRDYSTEIDELTECRDIIIHFLRKQIHTESNNTHIKLTEQIFEYWESHNLELLKSTLPEHLLQQVALKDYNTQTENLICFLKEKFNCETRELLSVDIKKIEEIESPDFSHIAKKRVILLIKIYNLLKAKYSFDSVDLIKNIKTYNFFSDKEIQSLAHQYQKNDNYNTLSTLFTLMDRLKKVILKDEPSEAREDIYFKRHIAAGIPSMYGRYSEAKFDALGLTFRLERASMLLLDKIISSINLEYITANTLKRINKALDLIVYGLQIDGIENESLNASIKMLKYSLKSNTFSLEQYKNIFQFMQDGVKEIINEFFFRNFDSVLKVILPVLKHQNIKDYFGISYDNSIEDTLFFHKVSEKVYRDLLSSAFIIQSLDSFISMILQSFNLMQSTFSAGLISQVMHYDPEKLISSLDEKNPRLDSQVFLGAKAYFLKQLKQKYMPIPEGFVLSTELFRYREAILRHPAMSDEIDKILRTQISILEKKTRLKFGDSVKPLLLSVRSGSPISMPGAMNTFLNIGLNDQLAELIGKNKNFKWTVWDCYRRLIQSWGMAFGINRDVFDQQILFYKNKWSVDVKVNFTAEQMRSIAYSYKDILKQNNVYLEQDLYKQVRIAIRNVLNSWDSDRAVIYRKQLEIANEWGTAVVIQKMAFGNISLDSGTGVVFTHDPSVKKPGIHLFGDYTLCSQGEDVVGGLVHTRPISEHQTSIDNEKNLSLENAFPKIYRQLLHYSDLLINTYGFNHQEIEFTFESPEPKDLYILQTRNQVIQKAIIKTMFADNQEFVNIASGTGIGNDVINGKVAFDMNDLNELKKLCPDTPKILIRPDTVPDDIALIFESEAIITARGGVSSHAAVTALRLGKSCIVNCKTLKVYDNKKYCTFGDFKISFADDLAIDPNTGTVYLGHYETIKNKNIQ